MYKIIAIDYDGTLALNSWPDVGEPNWPVIEAAKAEKAAGNKLILWTCREDEKLQEALDACESWGLTFDAVNENLPEMQEAWGNDPRKLGADEYWDDRAVRPSKAEMYQRTNFVGRKLKEITQFALELMDDSERRSNELWESALDSIRVAKHGNVALHIGAALGKAQATGDPEKLRLVEQLSCVCLEEGAIDAFLKKYGGK